MTNEELADAVVENLSNAASIHPNTVRRCVIDAMSGHYIKEKCSEHKWRNTCSGAECSECGEKVPF